MNRNAPTRASETRSRREDGIHVSLPRLKSERTASALTGSNACIRAKEELVTTRSWQDEASVRLHRERRNDFKARLT